MRKLLSLTLLCTCLSLLTAAQNPPSEWVDPATGHRVIRLSQEPGSASLYFHQNPFTASGDKMVFTNREGIAVIDLKTRQIHQLVTGPAGGIVVAKNSRMVYYMRGPVVYATPIDGGATRQIAVIPAEWHNGSGLTVNADETELGGSATVGDHRAEYQKMRGLPKGRMMQIRMNLPIPMVLYTIDIKTGRVKAFFHDTHWLNHVQFSPTDPHEMMFCHEGIWQNTDRVWTIRTDGTHLDLMRKRTMPMEISGHEFWSPDGKITWYDLQTPRGKEFWVGGTNLATGKQVRYRLTRDEWSVHYNVSPDGKLFAGDGGGPDNVAHATNGQWIYLFRPEHGAMHAEKLVNMAKHNYHLEPNVHFTPDGKWLVFRSNMFGPSYVFEVEVAKAKG